MRYLSTRWNSGDLRAGFSCANFNYSIQNPLPHGNGSGFGDNTTSDTTTTVAAIFAPGGGSEPALQLGDYPLNWSHYTLASQYHDGHLHFVYLVCFPVFIAVGVLANLIDLWVLSQPSMQGIAFRYLARLAVSDLLYLIFNIPFCLEDFALTSDGLFVTPSSAFYYAYIAVPIVNFFLTLSVYIIVWLSYDRWLAVCNPHKFPTRQSLQVVHRRCLATVLVTFVMYVPSPLRQTYNCHDLSEEQLGRDFSRRCCVHKSQYMSEKWFYYYEFVREIYSRFLPGVLITAFNVAIIVTLRLAKRGKKHQVKQENTVQMEMAPPPLHSNSQNETKESDDTGQTDICIGIQYASLNCCRDATTSPVPPFERIELGRAPISPRENDPSVISTGGGSGSNPGFRAEESEGIAEDGLSDPPARSPERSAKPCSIIPLSPEKSSRNSQGVAKPKGKSRYVVVNETRNDREVCLVILLLAITVFFYISSFPSALYKIIPTPSNNKNTMYDVFRAVADVLEISGHVFNFCLYFLLSPEFRRTLLSLLPSLSRIQSIGENL